MKGRPRPPRLKLGELVQDGAILEIQDGNHGEKHPTSADYVEEGIAFVMANDIRDGRVDLRNCKFVSQAKADTLRIGFSKTGDVLLTHKGTVGNVAVVPKVEPYIMLTPQVTYYRVCCTKLSNRYLAYAL
jgi:type I restriction enzyme S subunit